jgi:type II secretory pathway component GspD/PulD (secretin)
MSHSIVGWRMLFAVGALAVIPGLLSAAPAETKAKQETGAEKVHKALDQAMDLDLANQSLTVAIEQIKDKTKVNVIVDTMTLANNGIVPDQVMVTVKKDGAKARSCLSAVLGQYHLGYAIIGENVIVSTEDMALHRQFRQKVSLDLDKVSLETALKDLSKDTAVQILVDKKIAKDAQTQVTLELEDVSLDAAVRLLCEQAGVKAVRLGNILYITSPANAKDLRTEPELAPAGAPIGGIPIPGVADGPVPPAPLVDKY